MRTSFHPNGSEQVDISDYFVNHTQQYYIARTEAPLQGSVQTNAQN